MCKNINDIYNCLQYRYLIQHEQEGEHRDVAREPVLPHEETSINMTVRSILGFVVLMCIMLLCLYFLYAYLGKYSTSIDITEKTVLCHELPY